MKDTEERKDKNNTNSTNIINSKTNRKTITQSGSKINDIRNYLDPQTGKRKTLETTPEKQDRAKKAVKSGD